MKCKMNNGYKFTEQQLTELGTNLTAIIPKLLQQDKAIVNKFLISVQSSGEVAIDAYNRLYQLLMKYSNCKKEYTIILDGRATIKKNKTLSSKAVVDEAYYAIIELCKIMLLDGDKYNDNPATIGLSKTIESRGIIKNGIRL